MRFAGPMAAVVVVALFAPDSGAATLRGRVVVRSAVPPAPAALHAYPGHADALPGATPPARGLVSDAVVFVESVPAEAESALAAAATARPQLVQRGQRFVPRVLPVAAGAAVDFPNQDPIYHNVFSPSPLKRFDLGKYPRPQSRRVTFPRPGLVNVYCDIHSHMEAFILVLANHAFTQPSAAGEFALPDLPPGRYRVHVWHPDLHEQQREVELREGGGAAVEFEL